MYSDTAHDDLMKGNHLIPPLRPHEEDGISSRWDMVSFSILLHRSYLPCLLTLLRGMTPCQNFFYITRSDRKFPSTSRLPTPSTPLPHTSQRGQRPTTPPTSLLSQSPMTPPHPQPRNHPLPPLPLLPLFLLLPPFPLRPLLPLRPGPPRQPLDARAD